jgi:hypothetical protein
VTIQTQPLGMKNAAGVDIHAFVLKILLDGRAPYQIQVGNPAPPDGVSLLYPGANLPAKVVPDEQCAGGDRRVLASRCAALS